MKIIFRILKYIAILVIAAVIFLFTAARLMQGKVADIVLTSLNQNISTKLQVGGFRFSFLNRFPHASLELRNVLVHSSPVLNSALFGRISTDTLLAARNVAIEFRITDILKGNYTSQAIKAKGGRLNIFTDTAGKVNYDISAGIQKKGSSDLTFDLEKINLSDIKAYYYNLSSDLEMKGVITRATLKTRIHGDDLSLNARAVVSIDHFRLKSFSTGRPAGTEVAIDLHKTKEGIRFRRSNFNIEGNTLTLEGFISSKDVYDLKVRGEKLDISALRDLLPASILKKVAEYDPEGVFTLDAGIKGLMTKRINPHVDIVFSLEKGKITYGSSRLAIRNLSFNGIYSNGPKNRPATASVRIKDFRAALGSAGYTGSFALSRLDNPFAELSLKGRLLPGELREFFDISEISSAGGSADLDMKLSGNISFDRKPGFREITDMKAEGDIVFSSFTIGTHNDSMLVSDATGSVHFAEVIQAKNLKFRYRGQEIGITGEFRNLIKWLQGRGVTMSARGNVSFDRLIPEAFAAPQKGGTAAKGRTAFSLPGDLILDINFRIDSLRYKTFSSSEISGSLNYSPRLLTFKSFGMKALRGSISGNGFILQNDDKTVLSKGIFNVTAVDVNRAFTSFRNFGQNFLKAENIAGSLSGSFSILLPLDPYLNPAIRSLAAEGKATLVDGALINFDPVKQLSNYIELSELENIHFEKMENDFFIRSNYLYIPTMEVRSSAVDLSVNGKHGFDNDYEYHVKVLLSEILSKKRKKHKSGMTEFGEVQDDGLGRTSMLLKIVSKGDDVKVSYDMKAAAAEVKNNFKAEKKTMKTILNEEYGWFKKDTAEMQKPAEKKPKVRVQWDDK